MNLQEITELLLFPPSPVITVLIKQNQYFSTTVRLLKI